MKHKGIFFRTVLPAIGILMLIFDSRTALEGMTEGIEICVKTVIPSLFPFFVLSILLTGSMGNKGIPFLKPLGKLCGVPEGAEGLLLLGFLGGYPVGAQAVTQAWSEGRLTAKQSRRLLGFCSNCGPAFLFGIVGKLFSSKKVLWLLWGIHILGALLTGCLLPDKEASGCSSVQRDPPDLSDALNRGIRIMASVCGWIVLTKCFLAFADHWVFHGLPQLLCVTVSGLLELANGCILLGTVKEEPVRFLLVSGLLSFGGFCVYLQTVSVTGELGTGWYFQGKLLHMCFGFSMAALLFPLLYNQPVPFWPFPLTAVCFICFLTKGKKGLAFFRRLVYNQRKNNRSVVYAVPEES